MQPLPAGSRGFSLLSFDSNSDAAADVKYPGDFNPMWGQGFHQVVANLVNHMLVKCTFVAVRPKVELEGLGFHDLLIGHILYANGGEIRLTGPRAQAGEVLGFHPDRYYLVSLETDEF